MIAFLTQYLYGLGHSNRIKLIAEETSKYEDVIIINQLFKPPLSFNVPQVSFLEDSQPPPGRSLSGYVMNESLTNFRVKKFIETIEQNNIKLLVSEGFPFCRHQYANELFKCFEECKKRGIKIVVSIRDFPWDDPHDDQLKDWVNLTQNLICKYYVDKILVHGDPNILPLHSDRTKHTNSNLIIKDIKHLIKYTGYVCDDSLKSHEKKNNIIYVSTGLNKAEGMLLFKEITKIAHKFKDYKFVMPVANRYLKTRFTIFELTSDRFRTKIGILSQKVDELELYRVRDYEVFKPFLLRLFGLGNLTLITSDKTHPKIEMKAIKNPEIVLELFRKNVEISRKKTGTKEVDFT